MVRVTLSDFGFLSCICGDAMHTTPKLMTTPFLSMQGAAVRAPACFSLAVIATAVVSLSSSVAFAHSNDDAKIAETVVTAARTETKLDETLGDVRVITAEQIGDTAGRSLGEVLQRFAGAQLASNGGRGNAQTISIRGSSQIILLVDGVRFGSATAGDPSLQQIPLESIERIEVVHGPASALYGSDAIGGVIQIFTKQGKGVKSAFKPHGAVTVGQAGYKDGYGGFAGSQNGWNYSLNVARVIDPGFSVKNQKITNSNPDDDAFHQTSLNAALGYVINGDWRLDANLLRSNSTSDYDNGEAKDSWVNSDAGIGGLKLTGQITTQWKSVWRVGYSNDKQWTRDKTRSSGVLTQSLHQTKQQEFQWNNEIKTSLGVVAAGLEHAEQQVVSTTKYAVVKRDNNAVYWGLSGGWMAHNWQMNLRHDDNSQFGNFTTWGLGYGYEFLPGIRGYASRGKSMKAPTFNQLYYPGYGSANLRPEEALNTEFGVSLNLQGHQVRIARFDNKLHNMIAGSPLINISKARKKGWSLGYEKDWSGWLMAANYEHLDAYGNNGERYSVRLPEHQASLSLDKKIGAWKLGGSALYVGGRTDTVNSKPVKLNAYATLDLQAEYQVDRDWSVQARVANVANKAYETAYGYNQRGRAGFLTLKWTPK